MSVYIFMRYCINIKSSQNQWASCFCFINPWIKCFVEINSLYNYYPLHTKRTHIPIEIVKQLSGQIWPQKLSNWNRKNKASWTKVSNLILYFFKIGTFRIRLLDRKSNRYHQSHTRLKHHRVANRSQYKSDIHHYNRIS